MKRILFSCAVVAAMIIGALCAAWYWRGELLSVARYGYFALPEHMERRVVYVNEQAVSFLIARFEPDAFTWQFASAPNMPKTVKEWREHLDATFVVNGSYFLPSGEPSGFYQTPTFPSTIPWPVFSPDEPPVGYTFAVTITDGRMTLGYVPEMTEPPAGTSAFASFPTLVRNDESIVTKESGALAARTMLAQDEKGTIYVIVTESGEITLYEAAKILAAQPEYFVIAGNIDGGPSTGISTISPPWNVEIRSVAVPNVLVARERGQE